MDPDNYRIIRFILLRNEQKPIPIYTKTSRGSWEPIEPFHLTIFRAPETDRTQERFVLCFLDHSGQMLARDQYQTLDIALDQAHAIAGVNQNEWRTCDIAVPTDEIMPWWLFEAF